MLLGARLIVLQSCWRGNILWVALVLNACTSLSGLDDLLVTHAVREDTGGSPDATPPLPDASANGEDRAEPPPPTEFDADIPDGSDDAPTDQVSGCTLTSSGPRHPTAAYGETWSNDDGALVHDDSAAHSNGDNDDALVVGAFGFSVPSTAEIRGITIVISRNKSSGTVIDDEIRLTKGTTKANGPWPQGTQSGPYTDATYGSETDLWGADWSPADVNAPTFGVAIKVNGSGNGHVDAVSAIVHYCN